MAVPPPPSTTPAPSDIKIDPSVWENPYHPLPGPPQTAAERTLLQSLIASERASARSAISDKLTHASLKECAKDNCADVEWRWMDCLVNGGWWERQMGCGERKEEFRRCMRMQMENLKLLGYENHGTTAREKAIIADEADRVYLKQRAEIARKEAEEKGQAGTV
ncbi:uncharacterized protein EV422DRAFT_622864 [Fimicolochytrium jonesii]|uniref:uncharacterized protein n=1 Tax=Fimicolochytrium jonesii TaxID=1396493 RepID=UPI0022FE65B0|nr:uncharacterized protein EV422DRAFT_622864 [Fimicolochytrium jonesii]KAI8817188.1 hypothetical protein EV422DRAFT_622864 [Fimicolochytrium jonesii]